MNRATTARQALWIRAFTLLELMVVVGIIALVSVLLVPAFNSRKNADDFTSAAHTIAGALEQGRSYAMANNLFVWVGFYEESADAPVVTADLPPYPGVGRLLIATVCAPDGTAIFEDDDPSSPLPPARIKPVGKLIRVEGVHLADIGAPTGSDPETLDGRPSSPYTDGQGFSDNFNRISSESPDKTKFPFTSQNYTFHKTVRFNPRGEANSNSTYSLKRVAEIGMKPARGSTVDAANPNVVAIQFSGIGGNIKVYRR